MSTCEVCTPIRKSIAYSIMKGKVGAAASADGGMVWNGGVEYLHSIHAPKPSPTATIALSIYSHK